ncbi:hypothetical protein D9M71_672290 [compost metagenome]
MDVERQFTVAGDMAGQGLVVAQAEALVKITLAHVVQIRAQCPALAHLPIQQLTTDPGKHPFQIAAVDHAVQVFIQLPGMVELERRHCHV